MITLEPRTFYPVHVAFDWHRWLVTDWIDDDNKPNDLYILDFCREEPYKLIQSGKIRIGYRDQITCMGNLRGKSAFTADEETYVQIPVFQAHTIAVYPQILS